VTARNHALTDEASPLLCAAGGDGKSLAVVPATATEAAASSSSSSSTPSTNELSPGGALHAVWECLAHGDKLWAEQPAALAQVLKVVQALWQAGAELGQPTEQLRGQEGLWLRLAACLPTSTALSAASATSAEQRSPGGDGAAGEPQQPSGAAGVGADAFRLQAEAAAMQVMGIELHAALRAAGGAGGAEQAKEAMALCDTVRGWAKRPAAATAATAEAPLTTWLKRWLRCRLDPVLLQRTQLLAAQLALQLAAFLETAGAAEEGGLHAGLSMAVRTAAAELLHHPSARALLLSNAQVPKPLIPYLASHPRSPNDPSLINHLSRCVHPLTSKPKPILTLTRTLMLAAADARRGHTRTRRTPARRCWRSWRRRSRRPTCSPRAAAASTYRRCWRT
jgi:hypothetical protein